MHTITTEIKIQGNIIYPISMLEQVVGKETISNHHKGDAWVANGGETQASLEDDVFHCWLEPNGEIAVETLGAWENDTTADDLMDSVESMWGDEENLPIFYYTLLNWGK